MKGLGRKSRGKNSPGMMAIFCVTVILLGYLLTESRDLTGKLQYYEERTVVLERSIVEEKQRTAEIDALRAYMQTDAYAEQVAREKLGLVKENEVVFIEEN